MSARAVVRPPEPLSKVVTALALALGVMGLVGCGTPAAEVEGEGGTGSSPSSPTAGRGEPWEITPFAGPDALGDGATAAPSAAPTSAAPPPDVLAGVLSREVPEVGDGELTVVPRSVDAPLDDADHVDVAVSVEGGLGVDGAVFAGFVMATLNDPRSWPHDGNTFARTDGSETDADVTVVLASPDTSAALCRPLQTFGKLSCRNGDNVVLTWYRWVNGHEDYAADPTGYRRYLVNHEMGHFLGHDHVGCPGRGETAPVMMQQTLGLKGCAPNPWPYP